MTDLRLRSRSATELVDASFALYRREPLPYIMLTAAAYAPWLVIQLLLLGGAPTNFGALALVAVGNMITYSVVSAALVRLASQAYLGEPLDIAVAMRDALPRAGAIIVAALAKTVLWMIGAMFFLVGALYVAARFFALNQAIILEHRGVGGAFTRSGELSQGRKWHILGTLALVVVIYFVVFIAVGAAAALARSQVISTVVTTAYVVVAYPLFGIAETLLYYDARIRAEGYDIEVMAGALGGSRTTAETAAR